MTSCVDPLVILSKAKLEPTLTPKLKNINSDFVLPGADGMELLCIFF